MLALILALTEEESHDALTFLYKKYARKMLKVAKSELSKWENIDSFFRAVSDFYAEKAK